MACAIDGKRQNVQASKTDIFPAFAIVCGAEDPTAIGPDKEMIVRVDRNCPDASAIGTFGILPGNRLSEGETRGGQ
jgi:hypothetical protein